MGGGLATPETIDRWERLIAEGDRDSVIREFYRDIAGYDDAAIDELARSPVLLLVGTESPAWARRSVDAHAEALPTAEKHALKGQGHAANMTAPGLLAAELERFLRSVQGAKKRKYR